MDIFQTVLYEEKYESIHILWNVWLLLSSNEPFATAEICFKLRSIIYGNETAVSHSTYDIFGFRQATASMFPSALSMWTDHWI